MSVLNKTYYYFIGIGGIGMSALARYFKFLGKEVLGYDRTSTDLTIKLENEGIEIHYEDDIKFIPKELTVENTLVIYTPAVPSDHSEYQFFINNNFEIKKRSEVLGEFTIEIFRFALVGTYGKHTTQPIIELI